MQKTGYIILTLRFWREGKRWAARCEELGTAAYGRSIQAAEERLKEAVFLHLNTLEDVGECARVLEENGIPFHTHKPQQETFEVKASSDPASYFQSRVFPLSQANCA